jgi:hypothetical protein
MRVPSGFALPLLLAVVLSSGRASAEDPLAGNLVVLEQPHSFSRAEARERVQQLLDYWSARWGLRRDWRGDTVSVHGTVMGVLFDAELVVGDHWVSATASDPGFILRSAALGYVTAKLRKYLHPSYKEG